MARNPENLIPTRRSLLSRLKNWDDQESWKDFFDTYWKLIYGVAVKAGLTDAEAQEVVQETIIAVARNMQNFKYDPALGSFKNWLLHTARWRIADQFRKRTPRIGRGGDHREKTKRTSSIERIADPAGPELEAVWDAEWDKHVFGTAVGRIKTQVNPKHYQIFDLYVIKQWPVGKVARTLDINIGQVYLAKHRVSALLKKEIKKIENRRF